MVTTHHNFNLIPKIVLAIILIITVSIIIFTIFIFNNRNTINIESEISKMSAEYYEKYYFPDLENSIRTHGNSSILDVLSSYTASGFSRVPLRQIIAHTHSNQYIVNYISAHCDVDNTFIHFFPEKPFTPTAYHANYTYSCNF